MDAKKQAALKTAQEAEQKTAQKAGQKAGLVERAKSKATAYAYLAGWKVIGRAPQWLTAPLFRLLADAASDNGRGLDQLRANLARVVGPENVTRELVRDSMRSYMRYWLEAFALPRIHAHPSLQQRLTEGVEDLALFDEVLTRPQGTVLALTHSGNWDMAGAFLVNRHGTFTTVAERLKPEILFDAFVEFRQELGFDVLPLTGGDTPPSQRLREVLAGGGTVALLAERDLTRTGVTVDFFGEECNMAPGPAALARETGATLLVVHTYFTPNGWGLAVGPEIEVTDVAETTQRMADAFAAHIAEHPQDWHMLQPQWNVDVEKRRAERRARRAAQAQAQPHAAREYEK